MARTIISLLVSLAILLVGCSNGDEEASGGGQPTSPSSQSTEQGYPSSSETTEAANEGPVDAQSESGYPGPSQTDDAAGSAYPQPGADTSANDSSGYPGPSNTSDSGYPAPKVVDESKRFTIEEPISSGQVEISGTGVPDIAIKVISVSNAGEALGFGSVSPDGDFTIGLNRAAEGGELLGLQFADDSTAARLQGVPGTDFPIIGLILAQAVVER